MAKAKKKPTPKSPKKQVQEKPDTLVNKGESKQAILIDLLKRPAGATIEDMASATGWQTHSVRGVISGILKKKLGMTVASDREDRGRIYRITGSVSRL